jgi:hypothetical protein
VSAVTVVGEGTAAVNDILSLAHNSACIIIIITITLQLQRCHKPQDRRLGFPVLNDSPNVAHDSFKLFALVDQWSLTIINLWLKEKQNRRGRERILELLCCSFCGCIREAVDEHWTLSLSLSLGILKLFVMIWVC